MTFADWFEQATKGLGGDATVRLRNELGDYYQFAYEAQIESGASPEAAEQAVLDAMGDARAANREYRKVYLTEREERYVVRQYSDDRSFSRGTRSRGTRGVLVTLLTGISLIGLLLPILWALSGHDPIALIPDLLILGFARWLPIHTPARGHIFRRAKWATLILLCAAGLWTGRHFGSALLGSMLVLTLIDFSRSSIRRKLPVSEWPKQLFE